MTIRTLFLIGLAAAGPCFITAQPADSSELSETRDTLSASAASIEGNDFRRWPIRTIEDWLALQPGVTVRYPGAKNIYIRGARDYSSAYLMNGSRVEDPMTGELAATFSPFALDRLSLQTGAFDGHIGDFTGGVVGAKSPALFNAISGSVEVTSDNFGSGFDQNWYNATLYGPLGEDTGLDFFAASERRYLGDRQPSPIAGDVLPNGEKALPGNSLEGWSHHGRVTFAPCDKTTLSAWGDYSRDNFQTYRHEWYYYPEHAPRTEDELLSLGFGIERKLSQTVSLDVKAKYYSFERIHGDGVLFDDLAAYADGLEAYDQFILFVEQYNTFMPVYDYLLKQKSSYLEFDAALSFIPAEKHEVTIGFDARRYTIRQYENLRPSLTPSYFRVNTYGYDLTGAEIDSDSWIDGVKHPVRGGLYMQDRLIGDDYTVTGAIRVEYVDYNAHVFRDPANPFGPVNDGVIDEEDLVESDADIRVSPRLAVAWQPGELLNLYASGAVYWQSSPLAVYNNAEFVERRISAGSFYPFGAPPDKPQRCLALEGGGTIQATEMIGFRAGVAYRDYENLLELVHLQAVPFSYDLSNNFAIGDAFQASTGATFEPRPFLTLSVDYQLGFVRSTSSADGYNVVWKNSAGAPEHTAPTNWDQTHKLVGIFDFHTGPGEGPRLGRSTLLENTSFVATVYAASGFRYTKTSVHDEVVAPVVTLQPTPLSTFNDARQPMVFQIDLKLERTIPVGDFNIVPFLWIRNLLDRENVTYVYNGTGEPDYTGYLESDEGQARAGDPVSGEDFVRAYELRQNDPTNYAPPRQIYLGLRAEF